MARPRDRGAVIAANLQRIVGDEPPNAWARRHGLHQQTVRRILIGECSPTELMIERIADALGLFPWQLLVPDLDPRHPPVLRESTPAELELYARLEQDLADLRRLRPT